MSEMESALRMTPARTELLPIAGAGHELMAKANREDFIEQVTSRFSAFVGAIG
jgi:alpha-beta hydrolase superfamily lysophospholipase